MSLVGKRVRILFNTATWPVASGVYVYEGHNEQGHHVRRADGVQRIFADVDVTDVQLTNEDLEEAPH